MPIGMLMRFPGVTTSDLYDAVRQELGLPMHDDDNPNWPRGLISHAAGAAADAWCVFDVWESQDAFEAFRASGLGPAFEKLGDTLPQPEVTFLNLHNTYRHGR
jgi:hypothetical protein